eukprot:SAG11_NODE_123_length_15805_cov_15.133261_8_plen_87_part_00
MRRVSCNQLHTRINRINDEPSRSHAQSSLIRTGAVVDTLVRTKILQLYNGQGTVTGLPRVQKSTQPRTYMTALPRSSIKFSPDHSY